MGEGRRGGEYSISGRASRAAALLKVKPLLSLNKQPGCIFLSIARQGHDIKLSPRVILIAGILYKV